MQQRLISIQSDRKCNHWTQQEMRVFLEYMKENKEILKQNLVYNMEDRYKIFRKDQFFKNLSCQLKTKTPIQCKGKFYKIEKYVLVELLGLINELEFEKFKKIRKIKQEYQPKLSFTKVFQRKINQGWTVKKIKKPLSLKQIIFLSDLKNQKNQFTDKNSLQSYETIENHEDQQNDDQENLWYKQQNSFNIYIKNKQFDDVKEETLFNYEFK